MKHYVLVFYRDSWADEMDISGFWVGEQQLWNKYLAGLTDQDFLTADGFEKQFYIGSNQSVTFGNRYEYLKHFKMFTLKIAEFRTLKKLFAVTTASPTFSFGTFLMIK